MLRPERMSKVSVTGTRAVLGDVIEAIHELDLLHLSEYQGDWDGFETGTPIEGADDAAAQLVTVRSLQSILDVSEADAGPVRIVEDDRLETEIESVRQEVNELDDRRERLETELADVEERLAAVEPLLALGLDIDLLGGYDSLDVAVGEGPQDAIEAALAESDGVDAFETFGGDGVVAVFAQTTEELDSLADELVGVEFTPLEVPEIDGSPADRLEELEHEAETLRSQVQSVESELEALKLEHSGFLLAAEETLSIAVQKAEAPLSFATTDHTFVAEGWIPAAEYEQFVSALEAAVGDRVAIEELEVASFTPSHGHEHHEPEHTDPESPAEPAQAATAEEDDEESATEESTPKAAADGGYEIGEETPPVIQKNPSSVKPFEVLTKAVSQPRYTEIDPTVILFLTFPAFFGFMIGDLGYGALYTAIGVYLYTAFDSDAFKSMGGITIWAGLFTMLFGILYGEIFGLHVLGEVIWGSHPPIEKGLSPATAEWARGWLVVSVLVGILHLNVGYIFDFAENVQYHGLVEAAEESLSWILMLNGLWIWVFSTSLEGSKPAFLYETFAGEPFALGFHGFDPVVGYVGVGALAVGVVLLAMGSIVEIVEVFDILVNVLSYTRIAAVLLAKAGMAFTVNLLFFGAYRHEGEFHFMMDHGPQYVKGHYGAEAIMFPGLANAGIAGLLAGLVILVLGHVLVLALGVTSAGLQAVRLEYVEFFGKFYEGGGDNYDPFGHRRTHTTED